MIEIREATTSDTAILHRILIDSFRDLVLHPPSSAHRETPESLAERLRKGVALLAYREGEPVGCVFVTYREDYAYIGRLGVLPEWRGRGTSGELMLAAEEAARRAGYEEARLEVRLVLESHLAWYARKGYATIALHTHAGFEAPTYAEMAKRLR